MLDIYHLHSNFYIFQPDDGAAAAAGADGAGNAAQAGMNSLARPLIPGAENMMSEMQRKLAARRAKTENSSQVKKLYQVSFVYHRHHQQTHCNSA